MANNRFAGVAYVKVDGRQIPLRGKWKSTIDMTKREGVAGQDGVHGFKEMPVVPTCEGDVDYLPDVSLEEIKRWQDVTVTLELANGAVHVYRNAWTADVQQLDTEEGSFPLKFEAIAAEEVR